MTETTRTNATDVMDGSLVVTENNVTLYKISCLACRTAHRKCDRLLPTCDQCAKRQIECCYIAPKKRERKATASKDSTTSRKKARKSPPPPASTSSAAEEVNNINELQRAVVSIPKVMSLPRIDETFESRVHAALWFSSRASTLLHVPDPQDVLIHELFYQKTKERLLLEMPNCSDTSDLHSISEQFSRLKIRETAHEMYLKAREVVLHPDLYPHIASNIDLAKVCSNIGHYLITKSGNLNESRMYFAALKVFLESRESLTTVDTSLFNESERSMVEQAKSQVNIAVSGFYGAKILIYIREVIKQPTWDVRDVQKFIDAIVKSFETRRTAWNPTIQSDFPHHIFNLMKVIVEQEHGIDRYVKLIQLCDSLRQEAANVETESLYDKLSWFLILVTTAYIFTLIQANCSNSKEWDERIKEAKRNYANQITNLCMQSAGVVYLHGANISPIISSVSETHAEHALDITFNPSADISTLSTALSYLQADLTLMDQIYSKYGHESLKLNMILLRQRMNSITSRIEQLYQSEPQTLIQFEDNSQDDEFNQSGIDINTDHLFNQSFDMETDHFLL